MSVDIWPPISPEDLKIAVAETQRRELEWLLDELHETLRNLKHGLEDCYALLAPVDPGSTLVVSSHRNEIVKGYITRVGTRIVKGTLHLRLRTLPAQTLVLDPAHPIHLAPLTQLHALLTDSLDILTQTLVHLPPSGSFRSERTKSPTSPLSPRPGAAVFISAQLRLLSASLAEASMILKGPPLTDADPDWTTLSAAPGHFLSPPPPNSLQAALPSFASSSSSSHHHHHNGASGGGPPELPLQGVSIYWGLQDSCLVLWVRALEPAGLPLSVGMKFALAIGTARRLEHDESERVFGYCCASLDGRPIAVAGAADVGAAQARRAHGPGSSPWIAPSSLAKGGPGDAAPQGTGGGGGGNGGGGSDKGPNGGVVEVFVREKVRVESADPSLMSLSAKLNALSNTLGLARRNLAAVMGETLED